jgi:hypothetical protein
MAFDGKYNVTINTPMGKQEGVLNLKHSGSALEGTMEQGGDSVPIKNGSINGDTATWDVDVTKPMPLTLSFEGKENGDMMTGSVKLGAFGNSTFEAHKV